MNVPVLSKIKAWKEKRLRKKIVPRLQATLYPNPNGNRTAFEADNIIHYINNGTTYREE